MKAAKILAQKLRTFAHLILICRGNALAIVAREGSHFDRNSGLSLAWRCPINAANSMPQQGEDEGMGREVIHFFLHGRTVKKCNEKGSFSRLRKGEIFARFVGGNRAAQQCFLPLKNFFDR